MKFKSISILLFLIDLVYGEHGPLTADENQRRLETCGTANPLPFVHPWILSIDRRVPMLGTFISSRHFLISSELIFPKKEKIDFDGKNCSITSSEHLQFEHAFPFMLHLKNPNEPGFISIQRSLRSYYLPKHCTQEVSENFSIDRAPMILEFEEEEQKSPLPCLGAGDTSKMTDVWILDRLGIHKYSAPFTDQNPFFYSAEIKNGGILEQKSNNKQTVIGIRTQVIPSDRIQSSFYRMDWLEDSLCELVGICKEGAVRPEPQSSTVIPTTSGSTESLDPYGTMTLEPSTVTAGTLETSINPITSENPGTGTSPEVATTVPPLAVPHRRTMPPEYVDHGDYDMIFDSLYEFPEFREIEETPYAKKGCRKSFELVLVIFIVFLVE